MRRRAWAAATAVALTAAAFSSAAPATAEPGPGTQPAKSADCQRQYNPYQKSQGFLTSCGDHIYPLLKVATIPGGGKEYTYNVEGAKTVYKVPPGGFDARAASDDTLKKYGLPTRAAVKAQGEQWSETVGDLHPITPPRFLVGIPRATADNYSSNWSGWSTYRRSTTPRYVRAYGRWKEPTFRSTNCSNHTEASWTGLGGYKSGIPLAQDGTAYNVSGMAPHEAWSEVLPDQPYMAPQPDLIATEGKPFTALVHRTNGSFLFFMKNQYSGKSLSYYVSSSHYNGGTAEVIGERITSNGNPTALSKFVEFQVYAATASHPGGADHPFGSFPNHPIYMVNNGHTLAGPGSMFNGGKSFYDHFYNCI